MMPSAKTNINTAEPKLKYKHKLKPSKVRELWFKRIIIWMFIFMALYPIVYVVGCSFSAGDSFTTSSILPNKISFKNYISLFDGSLNDQMNFANCIKNSIILCSVVCIVQLFMTGTAAYAFSRMRFKGRRYGLMSLLTVQRFPMIMTVSAVVAVLYKYGLTDNLIILGMFIAGGSAFNIWLMKGFMDTIPRELDEAAMVDGASHWQVFTKIIIPLAKPMFAVILLFAFFGAYSEFVFSSALLFDTSKWTVAVALQSFISDEFSQHWSAFSAAAVIGSVPQVILFLLAQKHLQKGLSSGAVKG